MARAAKLKVYRTSIGFHDAYVAAPSQKAALDAWGSTHNLFARGVAEIVTDPKLTADPLAHPGTIIKLSRGTAAEQIAALPPDAKKEKPAPPQKADPTEEKAARAKPARKPPPRPSRKELESAESRLVTATSRYAEAAASLAREEAALVRRRRALEKKRDHELATLERTRDHEQEKYTQAIEKWRG